MDERRPPTVSVVVPALNEGQWLAANLKRLRQVEEIDEIVVADYDSSDETVAIARQAGAKVVAGGPPALGRNRGAAISNSDLLLFLDADTYITADCVRAAVRAMRSDSESGALYIVIRPLSRRRIDRMAYAVADMYVRLLSLVGVGCGFGNAMLVKRSAFIAMGGFDESLTVGEDVELLYRLRSAGWKVIREPKVYALTSVRRLRIEGRFGYFCKIAWWSLTGPSSRFRIGYSYRWQPYPQSWAERDLVDLRRKEDGL